ncbi:MAG: MBL fold metallo-hydrolase [Gemmatimonadota bacterium]
MPIDEAVSDVVRITTPLPFRPRSVHAYLAPLDEGGWMLVDGGIDTDEAWAALTAGIRQVASWADLRVHVLTHMHVDHMGLARRVQDASSVPIAMGVLDSERAAHAAAEPEEEADYRAGLLRSTGAPEDILHRIGESNRQVGALARFVAPTHDLPISRAPVPLAAEWIAVWTPGHTAGHISLFRERDGVLIAGDAILPTISPTIGVNRQRPDPVADYWEALDRLESLQPRIVLPGHGGAMRGAGRILELREELLLEGDRVLALLTTVPASPWTIAERRYAGRELPFHLRIQALRETLAHLEHLASRGSVERRRDGERIRFALATTTAS